MNGSLDDVKKELQALIKEKRDEVAKQKEQLKTKKKALRGLEKQHPKKYRTADIEEEILGKASMIEMLKDDIKQKSLERDEFSNRFSPVHLLPVKVESVVINFLLYEKMMKKLEGFQVQYEVTNCSLVFTYSKKNVLGKLELYDLTSQLKKITAIPVANICKTEG